MKKDINEIEREWDSLSEEEKKDIFLWKMIWFHHEKHIPGAPPHNAINNLAEKLNEASQKSDNLTKSIRNATWVAAIIGGIGVTVAIINLFK